MAEPAHTPPPAAAANAAHAEDIKTDAQAALKLTSFLQHYTPPPPSSKRDILQERFRIELSTPLPEFDSATARAYAAADMADPSKLLIAHVCRPNTTQRHRVIQALKAIKHQYILPVIAAGPIELSRPEEERFVVFYERPSGKKLSDLLLENQGQMNESFLRERIIAPIASAINQFEALDISHGSINPDNIYFNEVPVLGPCVSEPCGYSQPFLFEPLERLQTIPAAKGEGSVAQDYYALAVIVLYILMRPQHFRDMTQDLLIRAMFREGVYNALLRNKAIPDAFEDFFRGMLCINASDRWDYKQLKPWLEGKRYNVLLPTPPTEAQRLFEYEDLQAGSRRELAHVISTNWDTMADAMASGQIAHWVSISLRNKELAESLARIGRNLSDLGTKNEMQIIEQQMRFVLQLDPKGPIRLKQTALHIDGIESLALELHSTKQQQELQYIAKFIEMNLGNYWLEIQRKVNKEYAIPTPINLTMIKLDRLRSTIRYSSFGFGLERMLYDLNPELPCLSPHFAHSHVTTLLALLKKLDQLAPSLSKNDDPIDRHIAAFLASKLGIQHEIRMHDLAAIPLLATNRAVIALRLLALAQERVDNIQLPGLTHWLALRILPALDNVHSKSLRQKLKTQLLEQAHTGYTQLLAEVIVNGNYAAADQAAYQRAWNMYLTNTARIHSFRQGENIDQKSVRIGFAMAKAFSYMALGISLLHVVRGL